MISAIFGICLLLVVTADVVMSTLGVGANGPLAPRVARGTFHIIRLFPRQDRLSRRRQTPRRTLLKRRFTQVTYCPHWAVGTKKPAAYYGGLSRL